MGCEEGASCFEQVVCIFHYFITFCFSWWLVIWEVHCFRFLSLCPRFLAHFYACYLPSCLCISSGHLNYSPN